jgi:hypothetical protein
MTINQALDRLTQSKKLNLEQQDLKFSLMNLKMQVGGNTKIENKDEVNNLIEYGTKDGKSIDKE